MDIVDQLVALITRLLRSDEDLAAFERDAAAVLEDHGIGSATGEQVAQALDRVGASSGELGGVLGRHPDALAPPDVLAPPDRLTAVAQRLEEVVSGLASENLLAFGAGAGTGSAAGAVAARAVDVAEDLTPLTTAEEMPVLPMPADTATTGLGAGSAAVDGLLGTPQGPPTDDHPPDDAVWEP
ncbi:MAG: hypothetical protein JJU45_00620 [Acidimicrobiia bacterium]|nr:hypothetical protein [Acidimicrobiia bacterium]